jgi:hypothetical protein
MSPRPNVCWFAVLFDLESLCQVEVAEVLGQWLQLQYGNASVTKALSQPMNQTVLIPASGAVTSKLIRVLKSLSTKYDDAWIWLMV